MDKEALSIAMEHDPSRPGKFEGESKATVYYYYTSLNGNAAELEFDDPREAVYKVEPDEAEAFNIAERHYDITESENGFVTGAGIADDVFERLVREARAG